MFVRIKKLLADGEWREALKLRGYKISEEWTESTARSLLSDKPSLIKLDKSGKFVYRERTHHGKGMCYRGQDGMHKIGLFRSCGSGGPRQFVKLYPADCGEDSGYTYKRCGQWWIRSLKYNKVEPIEANTLIVFGEKLIENEDEEHNK